MWLDTARLCKPLDVDSLVNLKVLRLELPSVELLVYDSDGRQALQ